MLVAWKVSPLCVPNATICAHHPSHASAITAPKSATLPTALSTAALPATAELAATATAILPATLAEELLRGLRPIAFARPSANDLSAIKSGAGHYQQRDDPDDSFP
jgi:hypothetical protein